MNIRLHIERLVLEGVPLTSGETPLLQAAIEAEIGRLLAAGGVAMSLRNGGATPGLNGGDVEVSARSDPTQLGQGIARATYASIGTTHVGRGHNKP